MRVHVCAVQMTLHRADVLEAYLNGQDNIQKSHRLRAHRRCGADLPGQPEGRCRPAGGLPL